MDGCGSLGLAGHILGHTWARSHPLDFFCQLLDEEKLQNLTFGSFLSTYTQEPEVDTMFEEFQRQCKLQRSSILKSSLDDIQHFEIMFQLENQM